MEYRILTQSATYPFTSDFFRHLYPSNALFKTCKLILEENSELDIDNKSAELSLYKNDIYPTHFNMQDKTSGSYR